MVDIAPDAEDPASKRYHTIEEEDRNLNRNLGELEEGTRARNREFLRRLVIFVRSMLYSMNYTQNECSMCKLF